jgi:hypothetical protein
MIDMLLDEVVKGLLGWERLTAKGILSTFMCENTCIYWNGRGEVCN